VERVDVERILVERVELERLVLERVHLELTPAPGAVGCDGEDRCSPWPRPGHPLRIRAPLRASKSELPSL
jgi:hypothetical protein